ncbi:MAG: dienelactone hydrolase family protein [Actinobacteria bacterium]|nr:dienelactone hydrolase family protein [Actinomycetota bacterium]
MNEQRAESCSEWLTLEVGGAEMNAYLAAGPGAPRGAVVVLQEAFGVNAHIQSVANRLAADGYLALAPDLFHRSEEGLVDYGNREEAMARIARLGVEEVAADAGAAVAAARSRAPGAPVSVLGFCFGGRAAFTAACVVEGIDRAVVFYGPGIASGPHAVLDRVGGISARMLLLYGGGDPTISAADREAIEAALSEAGVEHESRVYAEAGHAFFCDARPSLFRAGPALDAWFGVRDLLAA